MSPIHGDANDHNVLVAPVRSGEEPRDRKVVGVVDFGDAVRSYTVGEAAIAAAYAMLGKADPLTVAARLVAGFQRSFPLREPEVAALFPLMGLRLCASVAISAHQRRREPEDAYLTVSEAPAWALLERLEGESADFAHYLFRQACGMEAVPRSAPVVAWLREHGAQAAPVVGAPQPLDLATTPLHVFDLGVETGEFGVAPEAGDASAWTDLLFARMKSMGAMVGVGRYDEVRGFYTSDAFRAPGEEAPEWRTVHLGVDLFLEPGSPVYAPFDAVVHSVAVNPGELGYGPTVILEHRFAGDGSRGDVAFWTLYGHLAGDVLFSLEAGQPVPGGAAFARVGSFPSNGNWAPHLHFQIIVDPLGMEGNYPGVARPSQRALWKALSPDPSLILRVPDRAACEGVPGSGWVTEPFPGPAEPGRPSGAPLSPPPGRSREEILSLRSLLLGPNLSIAYRSPLILVRGCRQFLYDRDGQAYLDCVNNVPHVGHNHPRVVEAGRRQMALLNTNTRYLHDLLVEYARRLVVLLPQPLSRVYFVCSGSEANELALRMARAHTRRKDVVVVEGGYHGHTSSLVSISPYKFDGPGGEGQRRWVHKTLAPDPYRGRFRKGGPEDQAPPGTPPSSTRPRRFGAPAAASPAPAAPEYLPPEQVGARYAEQVRQVLAILRAEGRSPAAFFCEPLLGCAGQIVPPAGYLAGAFKHVREVGGVCVADEVQVGFGRVGTHFWAFESQDAVPDILTLGKPIGNGHPIGAVVTTPEIAASFHNGMEYFNTFGGNPVSCAIGLAVLDVIRDEGLQENARVVGDRLLAGLDSLRDRHLLVGDVRGRGLYLGVELVSDRTTREPATALATRVKERLREHRILLSTDGPDENVLKIKPPLVFGEADADRLVETLDRILGEEEFRL
jgi:4-aminobutyrate aminotransferase-like enzyme/murein DD-endopeptidase MepM/ murein hydrolase activator NlpD